SVRWTGLIEPPVTGIYTFWIDPEGSRLMIDGEIVVNAWMKGARYRMGQIRLEAGRKVPIKVELRADGPAAKVLLQWYPPGQSRQAVPASQLYPPGDAAAPEVSLTATAATVTEGGTPVELKVERRGDTSRPLTVRLAPRAEIGTMLVLRLAERGDAVAGRDYAPVPDSITIPAGQAAASVPFVALDDKLPGQDRKAVFALDFNAGYNAAGGPVTIAIKNKHAPAPGGGTGLKGEYFAGKDFTNLKVTRVDATVDFGTDRWDQRPPAAGLDNKAMYAIRWTGEIEPLFSETYKIEAPASVYSTLRVWIDGKQVIDAQGKDALRIARVPLTAGRKVPIKIEYATTNFYGSNVHLLWSSASQFEQVVPKSQLYSAP
ncbi:MAG: PA14 domain-containing protein, partial [Planctomycetota bacterium]|nr:PA14 domain-containing protein [Planctomycetota bacterium]